MRLAPIILAFLAGIALAQWDFNPDAEFLTILPDARTSGLAGCGTALTDLAANTYYNPACLVFGPHLAATWTHVHRLPDYYYETVSHDYFGVAYRHGKQLGIAVNITYHLANAWQEDPAGNILREYRPFGLAPGLSAACRLLPDLSAGASVKGVYSLFYPRWYWERYWREHGMPYNGDAFTLAFDAGVLYRPLRVLTLGLAVANLGPNIRYDTTAGHDLPRRARFGIAFNPPIPSPIGVTVLGDVGRDLYPAQDFDDRFHESAGLELSFARLAFVRLGYFHGGTWPGHGFTWGVGLEYQGIKVDVGGDDNVYEDTDQNVRFQLSARL